MSRVVHWGAAAVALSVAAAVFLITKMFLKPTPPPEAPATKTCPECLEIIPSGARKCRACASPV